MTDTHGQHEQSDVRAVTVPLDALRALWDLYETWGNTAPTDPGDDLVSHGVRLTGIVSLLGVDDAYAMEAATDAVEPHEALLRRLLDGTDGPEDRGDVCARQIAAARRVMGWGFEHSHPETEAHWASHAAQLVDAVNAAGGPCRANCVLPYGHPGEWHQRADGVEWKPREDERRALDQAEQRGYQRAVANLRDVVQRTGSPAARWAGDHLEAVGPGAATAVHQIPASGAGTTPCCGRPVFELPRTDRLTAHLADVTCDSPTAPQTGADGAGHVEGCDGTQDGPGDGNG